MAWADDPAIVNSNASPAYLRIVINAPPRLSILNNCLDCSTGAAEPAASSGHGSRYFLEETDLVPGMNADEATKLRQARLVRRESES